MRILVTGAAGKTGTAVRKELAAAGHSLRLVDVRPIAKPEGEAVVLDIGDIAAVRRAMEGIEGVAHIAFGQLHWSHPDKHIGESFDVNAKGTFVLLQAALDAGVKRFVYTSTLSVFGSTMHIGRTKNLTEQSVPRPGEVYGLTKLFGEEACRLFAREHGLSTVILRLCNILNDEQWSRAETSQPGTEHAEYWRGMATHVEDIARAIHLSLTVPGLSFEILHIASDNPGRVTSIQKAKDLLGFWPRYQLKPLAVKAGDLPGTTAAGQCL